MNTASRSTPSLKESVKSSVFNEKNESHEIYNPSMSTANQYNDNNKYTEGHNNYDKHKDGNQNNYSKYTTLNETYKASKGKSLKETSKHISYLLLSDIVSCHCLFKL